MFQPCSPLSFPLGLRRQREKRVDQQRIWAYVLTNSSPVSSMVRGGATSMKKAEMSHSVLPAARPRALTRTAAIFTVALGFALNAIGARAEGNAVRFGPNLLLSDETRSPQVANRVESTIAANPLDLANLVVGYQVFGCQMKPCACRVVATHDGGSSWSDPVIVSPIADGAAHQEVQGSVPVVAPDGTVYVFYAAYNPLTGPLSIQYAKSRDGGRSWTAPATVASGLNSPGLFVLNNGMQQFGSASFIGIFANSFPTVAIPPDGTIFVAWTDFPNGSCANTDLGDYQGLAVTGNSIVPAWCDDRMKAVNIFTAVGTIDP